FDQTLREGLSNTLDDRSWSQPSQPSLPVKDGGLGIWCVSSLALPAFLASAAGTAPLQASILAKCNATPDNTLASNIELWSSRSEAPVPEANHTKKQSAWDRPFIEKAISLLDSSMRTDLDKARFNAAQYPHSGDWLQALPISS